MRGYVVAGKLMFCFVWDGLGRSPRPRSKVCADRADPGCESEVREHQHRLVGQRPLPLVPSSGAGQSEAAEAAGCRFRGAAAGRVAELGWVGREAAIRLAVHPVLNPGVGARGCVCKRVYARTGPAALVELGAFPPLLSPVCPLWFVYEFLFSNCQIFFSHCVGRRQILTVSIFSFFRPLISFYPPSPFPLAFLPSLLLLSRPPSFPSPPLPPSLPPAIFLPLYYK